MLRSKPQRVLVSLGLVTVLAGLSGCSGSLTKAQDALSIGDKVTAEVHLRKAAKQKSTKKEASKLLAILLTEQGDKLAADSPKEGEALYREALALDSFQEGARIGLAKLLMKRGFTDEANELLAHRGCIGCKRVTGLMDHQTAVNVLNSGDVLGARALFQKAFDAGHDPLDALGLAETYLAPSARDLLAAKAALEVAAPLVGIGQVEAEQRFQEIRMRLLSAAAAARDNDMVEELFKIVTRKLDGEPEFELRFSISQAQFRNGDSDPAIQRIEDMLETSGQYIDPTQRQVWDAALVIMYSARSGQYLRAGDPVGAVKDVAAALKIDGMNNRLKLQQVLAISANRLELALTEIEKAQKGADRNEVQAILHGQEVIAEMAEGKVAKAYDALVKAERLGADIPMVLLARAYVLATSRNEDLSKDDMQDARKEGGIEYPKNRVNQFPGALAYISHAKARVRELGPLHPFHGAGFDVRLQELTDEIKAFYPYDVTWYPYKGGLIELVSEGGQTSVEYAGPHWLKGTAVASTNNTAEIPVEHTGLVWLTYGDKKLAVVVENNAHITINVGPPAPAVDPTDDPTDDPTADGAPPPPPGDGPPVPPPGGAEPEIPGID